MRRNRNGNTLHRNSHIRFFPPAISSPGTDRPLTPVRSRYALLVFLFTLWIPVGTGCSTTPPPSVPPRHLTPLSPAHSRHLEEIESLLRSREERVEQARTSLEKAQTELRIQQARIEKKKAELRSLNEKKRLSSLESRKGEQERISRQIQLQSGLLQTDRLYLRFLKAKTAERKSHIRVMERELALVKAEQQLFRALIAVENINMKRLETAEKEASLLQQKEKIHEVLLKESPIRLAVYQSYLERQKELLDEALEEREECRETMREMREELEEQDLDLDSYRDDRRTNPSDSKGG